LSKARSHGGLAQGIGQALLEGAVYDSSGQARDCVVSWDYTMPRAPTDLPSFKLSHTTTLCPGNPLGVKGCGEAGAIGASARRHQCDHRRDRQTTSSRCRATARPRLARYSRVIIRRSGATRSVEPGI